MDIDSAMEQAALKLESMSDDGAAPVTDTAAAEAAPDTTAAEPAPTASTDTRTTEERARDEAGRFAKEKAEKAKAKQAGAKPVPHGAPAASQAAQGQPVGAVAPPSPPAPTGEPAPAAPVVKAPQSWTPAAREAFAKAPPEVQKEVARREAEIGRALQETAEARRVASQVRETLSPYEGIARASGMDSMKWVGSVAQTAATLHLGTQAQRAQVVAQIIGTYGVDVDAVNAYMQGQPGAAHAQPAAPAVDPRALVREELQTFRQQAIEAQAQRAWSDFQASEPEFLDAVREDMRIIIEREAAHGRNVTYQQAYDRACKLNEEVASVLAQRKAAEAVRAPQPVTQAARMAAGSARSRPAAAPAAQPKGIDAAMRAAAEKLGIG